jgi:hypothetical protein
MASLEELTEALDDLVVALNTDWRLHRELFQADDHYPLLDESGPLVWVILQDALIDSVFMSASRLLDPALSCGKENLSFAQIISKLRDKEENQIQKDYQRIKGLYASALRDWRNRKLSHNDLGAINGVSPLADVSLSDVATLIDGINELAVSIGHTVRNIHQSHGPLIPNPNWVWGLTRILRSGIENLHKNKKP